jgi:AcrR family transcriptional regulator
MPDNISSNLPQSGRVNQKLRTRREILRGARELMQRGEPVTVAAAAKHVGISTATSYRYFSDPETMKLEAVIEMDLGATGNFIEDLTHTFRNMSDVRDRVIEAHRLIVEFVRRNENPYRLFVAKGHEQIVSDRKGIKVPPRGGRRVPMIELALEPARARMSDVDFDAAVLSLSAACGPEPYFVLKDLCGLPDDEIDRICERNLSILVAELVEA